MRDHILFAVNGREHREGGGEIFTTLANWLRYEAGATGTKIVCEEGDCGACTVLIRHAASEEFRPVNSCILALCQLDGASIVTVEGLGMNAVQQSMIANHGAQCGYCTPGFVVAMSGMFERSGRLNEKQVRDGLTGNLCRCTGYEPIIKAALAVDGTSMPKLRERYPHLPDARDAVGIGNFFAPTTIGDAVAFKRDHPGCTIVQGGTDVGVWINKRRFTTPAMLSLTKIEGLNELSAGAGALAGPAGEAPAATRIVAGANVTLAAFEEFIRDRIPELYRILNIFGSPQIKWAGTLVGNIANGSPIGDTLPYLFVADAQLEIAGASGTRIVPISSFYRGYKQFDLRPEEIITRVFVPVVPCHSERSEESPARLQADPSPSPRLGMTEYLKLYKVSRRRDLDISAFTAAIRLRVNGHIEDPRIAYGGVAPTVIRLPKTEAFLAGKKPSLETFERAGEIARGEVRPISDVRGSAEFRAQLAENILSKFWWDVIPSREACLERSRRDGEGSGGSAPHAHPGPSLPLGVTAVGRNVPHDSARGHVSGESIYVDDMPFAKNELLVDFFWSPVAYGRIRSLDTTAACRVPGVAGVYTHRDLAHNLFGPIIKDELLLAEDTVTFIGQPIVVIAAENRDAIRDAKAAIKIDIERLEPVFAIDEAKRRKQFIGPVRRIARGDPKAAFAAAENILEGTWINAGQDHFYLEGQAAIAYPGEFDSLTLLSSTQNPSEVQEVVAHLLGLQLNQVVVTTKRMGGAFGGKECQATHPAAMAALVAQKTKRPARIVYSKDDDMRVTGGRHPFQNDYKVAFTNDGVITTMKVDLFSDGGAFADLSPAVMGRAMAHVDNAYFIPNIEITGTICRTDHPPNTAFRGFGGPQGVATIENIIEEIAVVLKRDPLEIRMKNCYGIDERNVTPYGQTVRNNFLPRLFKETVDRAEYHKRRAAVAAFNAHSKTHLRGLACTAVKFGISFNTKFLNQANALVNVYLDGSVQVSTGATEMGQGVNTKIRQLVADEFGIDVGMVSVMITSTEKNNNTSATAASSAADLNGSAAVDACRKIKARLAEVDAGRKLAWPELIQEAYHQRVSLGDRGFYATQGIEWDPERGTGTPFLYYTQGCAISEVEIDRFTGMTRILRSDVLMDIGKPINPGIDRGQMTGGFVQCFGWLTTEELRYTPEGELLTHSPTTYKIPNIQDVPEIFNLDWIENEENTINLRASKAVGEPPFLLGISVFCAIKNALSYVSNGAIPKLRAPATGEEILMRLTEMKKITAAEAAAATLSAR